MVIAKIVECFVEHYTPIYNKQFLCVGVCLGLPSQRGTAADQTTFPS